MGGWFVLIAQLGCVPPAMGLCRVSGFRVSNRKTLNPCVADAPPTLSLGGSLEPLPEWRGGALKP